MSEDTPFITVVLATYNGERFLQPQLDSLVKQTRPPCEVVIVDDASTDDTMSIVDEFQSTAPFAVRVCRQGSNVGHVKAFEIGLGLAAGRFVFFCDQDDVWLPTKIERMTDILVGHPSALLVVCDLLLADQSMDVDLERTQLRNVKSLGLSERSHVTGCATAFSSNLAKLALPFPEAPTAHDEWMHLLADALGVRTVLREPLQIYRRHGNNLSDWLASSMRSVTMLESIRRNWSRLGQIGWQRDLEVYEAVGFRIANRASEVDELAVCKPVEMVLAINERRLLALRHRLEHTEMVGWRRVEAVLKMLLTGDYGYFSGWRSAAKDLVSALIFSGRGAQ